MAKDGSIFVSISQVSRAPMDLLASVTGTTLSYRNPNIVTNTRGTWNFKVSGIKAKILLTYIVGYMRQKKDQAQLAIYLFDVSVLERKAHQAELTSFNRIGKSGPKFDAACLPGINNAAFPTWTPTDASYHAGFFDAEGCVVAGCNNSLCAVIVQVDPTKTLSDLSVDFLTRIYCSTSSAKYRNTRPLYRIQFYGDKGYVYLSLIRPYLLVKREQAEVFSDWYDIRGVQEKEEACQRLHTMNLHGLGRNTERTITSFIDNWCPEETDPFTSYWQPDIYLSAVPTDTPMNTIAGCAQERELYTSRWS
jgi:hypothetical protein